MYRLKDAEIEKATKAGAKDTAETPAYQGDCKLYDDHVTMLASEMEAGNFHVCIWAFTTLGGKKYRINGKHTSLAMLGVAAEKLARIKVCRLQFTCDTAEDIAALYSTFDSMESSRKARDIYQMYAAGISDLRTLPSRVRDVAISGLALWKWDRNTSKHSAKERAQLLVEHGPAVVFVDSIFRDKDGNTAQDGHRLLLRASVTAAMAATFSVSQRDARLFWTEVRDGSNPAPRSPSRVLQKWLLSSAVTMGRGAGMRGRKQDSRRGMFVRCLHAWNAWREGTVTDLKYYDNAKVPALK